MTEENMVWAIRFFSAPCLHFYRCFFFVYVQWKVIGRSVMCCGCQGDDDVSTSSTNEMSDVMLRDVSEPITSSFIHPGDSHVSLSKHAPLCLPGNIIHVVRNHPSSAQSVPSLTSRLAPYCTVLPPGQLNSIIPVPPVWCNDDDDDDNA